MSGRAALAAAAISALALAVPAVAQQPDSVASTDSVHARRLPPQVVSGSRLTSASSDRASARVNAVDLSATGRGPAGAATALAALPGVSVFDDQGSRAQPSLDVRGFTLSPVVGVPQGVSVFLDGVRVNEPDAQQVHFDLLPIEAVEHAELLRGPSALFGKNTLAGALSLVTRRGEATPVFSAEVDGGAYGYHGGRVTAGGVANGFDGFLYAGGSNERGYRIDTPASRGLIFGTLGRRGSEGDIALSLLAAHDRIAQAGSLPESWRRIEPRANYTLGDFFTPTLLHIALRGTHPALGGELRGNVYERHNATEQFNVNVGAPSTRAFVVNNSSGTTGELALPLRVVGRPLALTFGAEYAHHDVRYRIVQEASGGVAPDPADCDLAPGGQRGVCERAVVPEDDAGLFAQAVLDVGERLSATAAVRGDWVRVPFEDRREPANSATSTFRRLSPRVGVAYRLTSSLRGYLSAGAGFRAPAALELACADEAAPCPLPFSLGDDPPLAPVSVWNYETGASWSDRRLSFDGAIFRTNVRNEIVFATAEGSSTRGFFQNVARTRRQGAELSGSLVAGAGVRLFATYGYLDATFRSPIRLASALDTRGSSRRATRPRDRFPLAPAHRGTAGVSVTHLAHSTLFDMRLSARSSSSRFLRGDEINGEPPLGGYVVTDLQLKAERARIGVTAGVTNLFDRRYDSFGVYGANPLGPYPGTAPPTGPAPVERFVTPGYPRAATLTVRVSR